MADRAVSIGAFRVVSRHDHLDLAQFEDMLRMPGWHLFEDRLANMIEAERLHLESSDDGDFVRVQGKLEALRRVKSLPSIIRAEIQARKK